MIDLSSFTSAVSDYKQVSSKLRTKKVSKKKKIEESGEPKKRGRPKRDPSEIGTPKKTAKLEN